MSSRIFVDTSALVVLADRSDQRHEAAVACRRTTACGRLHLTDYIIDETLTLLRMRNGLRAAGLLVDEVRSGRAFELVFVGPELFWKAEARFRKLKDGKFSFTDCASFVAMDHHRIQVAFTFDDDFRRAGYECVP